MKQLNEAAKYSSMAIQMLIIIGIGVFAGIKLDKWLHTKFPVFTIVLSLLSIGLALYYFIKETLPKK